MDPVYLFSLASKHRDWIAMRQTAIAENIANANTPQFKARDIVPFSRLFEMTELSLTTSHVRHMSPGTSVGSVVELAAGEDQEQTHGGNSVSIEGELMKAGEASHAYQFNTGIVRSFHRMLLSSTKG
jgi:flagellar basal-body rod protein FlgB